MWEISSFSQILASFYAFLLGMLLALFYDIIKVTRKLGIKNEILVFLGDIFFSFFAAILTFLFLLVFTNGALRAYVILLELIGFIVFRIIFSKLFLKFLYFLFSRFKKIFVIVSTLLFKFSNKIEDILLKFGSIIKKTFKKRIKSAKKS